MGNKLRIGIIGFGRIGQVHASCLLQHVSGVDLVGISDPFLGEVHNKWLSEHNAVSVQTWLESDKILNNTSIDAVLICSSSDTHLQYINEAASAGKHIFCEKPIDFDVKRIQDTLNIVEKNKVKLQLGFNRRFDHNFMQLKKDIASKKIGDLHILKITSRDPEPPPIEYVKVSGGLFLDMMIHDFDMARFLSGEVKSLQAIGACLVNPAIGQEGDIDTAVVTLQFDNGAIGIIDNSRQAVYGYDQRIEIFGTKGMSLCDNDYGHNVRNFGSNSSNGDKPLWFFLDRYQDAYTLELQCFIKALRDSTPVMVTGIDGLRATELGLAAKESLATGKPVSL